MAEWIPKDARRDTADGAALFKPEWFDLLPSPAAATFRPALVTEGRLLKKGLASDGRG